MHCRPASDPDGPREKGDTMTSSKMMIAAMILLGVSAITSAWLWFVPKPSHAFTIAPVTSHGERR